MSNIIMGDINLPSESNTSPLWNNLALMFKIATTD